jgi:hypothetical protein
MIYNTPGEHAKHYTTWSTTLQVNTLNITVKYIVLGIKSRDCLAQNQDNVSEWSNICIRGLLVRWARSIKNIIQCVGLVQREWIIIIHKSRFFYLGKIIYYRCEIHASRITWPFWRHLVKTANTNHFQRLWKTLNFNNIVLLRDVFHIGLIIGPRSAVLAWGTCIFINRPTHWIIFFILLAHWTNSPRINMLLHSDTLSWFWAKQSLLLIPNTIYLTEVLQIQIFSYWFDSTGTWSHDLQHSRWAC